MEFLYIASAVGVTLFVGTLFYILGHCKGYTLGWDEGYVTGLHEEADTDE